MAKKKKSAKRKSSEENNRQARMDFVGCARIKIAGEEKGRRCPNLESVEANRWRDRRQGASTRGVVRYKGMR